MYKSQIIDEIYDEITPLDFEISKNKMDISNNISDIIKNKGLSITNLAELMNKEVEEVKYWLSGTKNFDIELLTEIAYKLDISLKELF